MATRWSSWSTVAHTYFFKYGFMSHQFSITGNSLGLFLLTFKFPEHSPDSRWRASEPRCECWCATGGSAACMGNSWPAAPGGSWRWGLPGSSPHGQPSPAARHGKRSPIKHWKRRRKCLSPARVSPPPTTTTTHANTTVLDISDANNKVCSEF